MISYVCRVLTQNYLTSGGDLLAQVRGGDNLFGERDAIIFEEDEFESAFDIRVGVDDTTHRRDKFDDLLRDVVAWIGSSRKAR